MVQIRVETMSIAGSAKRTFLPLKSRAEWLFHRSLNRNCCEAVGAVLPTFILVANYPVPELSFSVSRIACSVQLG